MLVPYKVLPDQYGSFIYSAALGVNLALPQPNAPRTKRFEAIIDSGASRCLFHASIATYLGLDLKSGVMENCNGIGGQQKTWIHDVTLYIPGGTVVIKAGFTETLPAAPEWHPRHPGSPLRYNSQTAVISYLCNRS